MWRLLKKYQSEFLLLLILSTGNFYLLELLNIHQEIIWFDTIGSFLLLGVFCGFMSEVPKYNPIKNKAQIIFFGMVFVLSLLVSGLLRGLIQRNFPGDENFFHYENLLFYVKFLASFLMLWIFFQRAVNLYQQEENRSFSEELKEIEQKLMKTEMANMDQQFQPHFLFNSLNSINALIKSSPDKAREMLLNLSDFLRLSLAKRKAEFNSVQEEIEYLQLYMSIEKVRFGERLAVNIQTDENSETCQLPSLILQPLVENAIKHGINNQTGIIAIDIQMTCENQVLTIAIENTFDDQTNSGKGTGYGLQAVERKLNYLYQQNNLMKVKKENLKFMVHLKIPQQ